MTRDSIRKLWWLFASFSLLFNLFAFLKTTGMTPMPDPFGVFKHSPSGVPGLALPIEVVSFALALGLVLLWLARSRAETWIRKVPVPPFFNESDVDPTAWEGKAFQAAVIFIFLITPFALLLLMCVQYLKANIFFSIIHGPTVPLNLNWWHHFDTVGLYRAVAGRAGYFVLGDAHGPQYYPVLTWLYFLAVAAISTGVVVALRRLFRRR